MTEFVIKLRDESKIGFLLATLKRLVTSHGIDLAVEQNGQGITLDGSDDAHFEAMINQVVEDALAGRLEPMTPAQREAEWRELAAYGEQKAVQMGINADEDIDRLVNQYRQEQRAKNAA
ncbi:MAG: hypothetical protein ACREEM_29655 [Blastocatellia bacterium]